MSNDAQKYKELEKAFGKMQEDYNNLLKNSEESESNFKGQIKQLNEQNKVLANENNDLNQK